MMLKVRYIAACAAVAIATSWALNARAADAEQKWLGVLQSGAPQDKAMACKKLAVCGTKDSVPALSPLLADERLASWARIALEAIPDPAADAALREASGKLQGRMLVGVLNSIGVRRDGQAIAALAAKLSQPDTEVAAAAAVALGRIGGPAAAVLEEALIKGPPGVRPAVAEGCVLCAERLLKEGKTTEAARLYDLVRQADVPKQRILEATRGAILARGAAGMPLLLEQLRSPDKSRFAIGLRVARELPGSEVTAALAAEVAKAAPARQAVLLLALTDRGDAAALPTMLEAAKSGPPHVRIAAIRVLERHGNLSCVPVLLDAALGADGDLSQAAVAALAGMPGKDVDADLAARLPPAGGKLRQLLIDLAGQRRIEAATPPLLQAADDPDEAIRCAALVALGATISLNDLPMLIGRAVNLQKPQEAKAAEQALRKACVRMADREACAEKLAAAMPQAPLPVKSAFVEILGAMGGAKALQAVSAAARDGDPKLQDTGSRMLGEWMSADAAPELLAVAKSAADDKIRTRALRGYIRIARQLKLPEAQRLEMCHQALAAAQRDEERILVVQVLPRIPSAASLAMALPSLGNPRLRDEAGKAALTIGEKIVAAQPAAVADAMQKVIQSKANPELVKRARALADRAGKP